MKNYYEILNLKTNVSNDEIKRGYKEMASKFHPDKYPENSKFAEDMMKDINVAYSVLSDEVKRKAYDDWLATETGNTKNNDNLKSENANNNSNTKSENKTDKQNNLKKWKNNIWIIGFLVILILIIKNFSGEEHLSQNQTGVASETLEPAKSQPSTSQPIANQSANSTEDDTPQKPPKMVNIPDSFLENAKINIIESPKNDYRLYLKDEKFTVYFRKKMDAWILDINGSEVAGNDHLIKVYEIAKNKTVGYYIFQTQCGGSACDEHSYSYYVVDLEHRSYSRIPLIGDSIDLDIINKNIYVSGIFGSNNIGDPSFQKLIYYPQLNPESSHGYWINPDLPPRFLSLLGEYPNKFFSDNELRNRMVDQLQPNIFKTIRDRTDVSEPMTVEQGHLLVLEGCMAHACDSNNAKTIVDMMNDKFHSIYQEDGKFYSVGDNMKDEEIGMGDSIYPNLYRKYLSEYNLRVDISENGVFSIKNL